MDDARLQRNTFFEIFLHLVLELCVVFRQACYTQRLTLIFFGILSERWNLRWRRLYLLYFFVIVITGRKASGILFLFIVLAFPYCHVMLQAALVSNVACIIS